MRREKNAMRFDIYHPGKDKDPMVGIPASPYDPDIGLSRAGKRGNNNETQGKLAAWRSPDPHGLKLCTATRLRDWRENRSKASN
jgi:hypothetical protein